MGSSSSARVPGSWHEWFDERRREVDRKLSKHLNVLKERLTPHSPLLQAVEYSLTAGGKRLRPVLVVECCRLCGGAVEAAWPAALAIECVHTFSLIHDDLPAMDDDDLRRGRPTSHKVFGEAVAVLAGDWLLSHAFELICTQPADRTTAGELAALLAAGTCGMIVGQGADVAGEQRPPDAELVQFIHLHKTAALIETACRLGAVAAAAPAERRAALGAYGRHLGLAFQIADDLLDATGSDEKLGKKVGKDADGNKQTYPAVFGIDESRRQASRLVQQAVDRLEAFGSAADHLRHLAWFVVDREW